MRVGVECGGTFTDLVVLNDAGELLATNKVFSTPTDPADAVMQALSGLSESIVHGAHLLHGSTVATNALIERNGARVGLIVTRGFRDIVFLQRQDRTRMYDLKLSKPEPLVLREDIREVRERLSASGEILMPLNEQSARTAVRELIHSGVEVIAVTLLHSYANPLHEDRLLEIIAEEAPGMLVALSSECAREFREYERTTTTTVDAFLRPRIGNYLRSLERDARLVGVADVQVMQSNGGMVPLRTASVNPLTMLRSGPAAGVAGALAVASRGGYSDIVTMDMGGTSTDVAVVRNGKPELTAESVADGLPVRVPMVDIVSVGAGGGSLVGVDSGGLLTVGPQSAGASPGPACYALGGTVATVTDANVVRGLLRPETFLGGKRRLDSEAATASLRRIASVIGRPVEGLAEDIYRLANVHMAGAIRMTTTERGYEVTDYTLCAYGGAGGLHAASVAEELGIQRVIIPPYNGLASAYGLLTAGFRREFSQTVMTKVGDLTAESLNSVCFAMKRHAMDRLSDEAVSVDGARFKFSADMRYAGQGYEVLVDLPALADMAVLPGASLAERIAHDFIEVQHRRFGYVSAGKEIQLVTLRLTVSLPTPEITLPVVDIDTTLPCSTRRIVENDTYVTAVFRPRRSLGVGGTQSGPAVLEDETSTTFIPTGWKARVDEYTNLILERD